MSPAPYDHNALWLKAKLFINRAMDDTEERSFDERALWACLALELLAKAALARISPLLIADPKEDGTNLLVASGLLEGDARFVSVGAHTLFSRCSKAFKPFNDREAKTFANARNEYLHGSGVGFLGIPERAWWPKYWAQAKILIGAMDSDLEELVGYQRANIVNKHLAENKRNVEHRVEALIARAQQRLARHRAGALPAKIDAEWHKLVDLTIGLSYRTEEDCPACGELGDLEGDNVLDRELEYAQIGDDDFEAIVDLRVGSDFFSCSTCRLVLGSYELLERAGVATEFHENGDPKDYFEPEYGND